MEAAAEVSTVLEGHVNLTIDRGCVNDGTCGEGIACALSGTWTGEPEQACPECAWTFATTVQDVQVTGPDCRYIGANEETLAQLGGGWGYVPNDTGFDMLRYFEPDAAWTQWTDVSSHEEYYLSVSKSGEAAAFSVALDYSVGWGWTDELAGVGAPEATP